MKELSYTLRKIPDDLWKKVKFLSVEKETTIREIIIDLLEREVKKESERKVILATV